MIMSVMAEKQKGGEEINMNDESALPWHRDPFSKNKFEVNFMIPTLGMLGKAHSKNFLILFQGYTTEKW